MGEQTGPDMLYIHQYCLQVNLTVKLYHHPANKSHKTIAALSSIKRKQKGVPIHTGLLMSKLSSALGLYPQQSLASPLQGFNSTPAVPAYLSGIWPALIVAAIDDHVIPL